MEYREIQRAAKDTISYIKTVIRPGMHLIDIRRLCEEKLLSLGADSFWYWDVGAFVFSGEETTVSVSGREYVTSDRLIGRNDIITIDLSPQSNNIWGDYARTIILENGEVVDDINKIQNKEWRNGLLMEERLHQELISFAAPQTTFEELYLHINGFITENGFRNLDFISDSILHLQNADALASLKHTSTSKALYKITDADDFLFFMRISLFLTLVLPVLVIASCALFSAIVRRRSNLTEKRLMECTWIFLPGQV